MKKRHILLPIVIVLVAVLSIGGIMAYFTDGDRQMNAFVTTEQTTTITEEFDPEPDPDGFIKKKITINNVGQIDAYMRMRIMYSDEEIAQYITPSATDGTVSPWLTINGDKGTWVYNPDDEFYYLTKSVPAGTSVKGPQYFLVADNMPYELHQKYLDFFQIYVYVESWQSEGYPTYQDCWAFVDEQSTTYNP